MQKINKVLLLAGLVFFCSSAYSQESTAQKQATTITEQDIPIKCTQVINLGFDAGPVAVDSKGNIYTTGGKGIKVYDKLGQLEFDFGLNDSVYVNKVYGKEMCGIGGIDIDEKDNIYISNAALVTVEVFTTAGEFKKKISFPPPPGKGMWAAEDIAVDSATIYTIAYGEANIYIFTPDGLLLKRWNKPKEEEKDGSFGAISSIATDRYSSHKQKRIYVGAYSSGRVYVFDKNRRLLFTFGNRGANLGEFLDINGIDVDSEGNIYVLDGAYGACSVFNTDGKFLYQFGHKGEMAKTLYFSKGIFIDKNDKIYIGNGARNNILVWEKVKK
ncbi:MAG: 6-bladed beta-propeller [Candidatus Margulisbacteria bacterium]|nr:6-bladed beta-propeller [Candidatus Margulisiibacteriota bacterium]